MEHGYSEQFYKIVWLHRLHPEYVWKLHALLRCTLVQDRIFPPLLSLCLSLCLSVPILQNRNRERGEGLQEEKGRAARGRNLPIVSAEVCRFSTPPPPNPP
jgi:hypothetical protein